MSVEEYDQPLSDEAREKLREAMTKIPDATFDALITKPRRSIEFFVQLPVGDDQKPRPARLRYQALDPKQFDDLVAAHPPSAKQKREGGQWDPDTFPAALISAVALVPRLTFEQARDILESKNWAPGESNALFTNAIQVCTAGLDVPFSAGD